MILHSTFKRHCRLSGLVTTVFVAMCMMGSCPCFGQDQQIPVGSWRAHLSYNNIVSIAIADDVIFGASRMGILMFDKTEHTVSTLSKVNGLSSANITDIAFNNSGRQLVIAYEDGNLDVLHDNTITNFSRLKDVSIATGSKRINDILVSADFAYLATDYGIVVFDMKQNELRETWRDLGRNGDNLKINKLIFFRDSIVAATQHGIIIGSLSDNLLDFTKWKRLDTGDLSTNITSVAMSSDRLFAAIDTVGIFAYSNNTFVKQPVLDGAHIVSMESSDENLLIAAGGYVWVLDLSDQLIQVADDVISAPVMALQDDNGVLWIADSNKGLISNSAGTFENYLPNGPSFEKAFRLRYADNKIFAVMGGFTSAGEPLGNPGTINYFENGLWTIVPTPLTDVTDVALIGNKVYASSFGTGLLERDLVTGSEKLFDDVNSPLVNADPAGKKINLSALTSDFSGLWVANYGVSPSLHLLRSDQIWHSFHSTQYPTDLVTDPSGQVWIAVEAVRGGGLAILDPVTGATTFRSDTPGSGGLLNRNVRSMDVDREGNVWIGTDTGPAYFYSANEDAVIPIYEERFLLRDEKITAIEVDGGNRKWIGTEHGVWLVNPTGEAVEYHFNADNSPLLSDVIYDIEIHDATGETFFATANGIVSFRSDATEGADGFTSVKIFPNPVTSDFGGLVGISGLTADAMVKITDVSGKLIWQARANGGTATWNVRNYNGVRAHTGIYLVFASTQDGTDSIVGKIAIID